ncbi:MAG: hypothetical protein QMD36_01370 [Candidatus Aenigmarchaeota archaeon]|nr:hypothetical protein [Candidatus Aenigmarchaeota archaeon]
MVFVLRNRRMRKGIHPLIPFIVALGILLVLEYFYVSYFVRTEFIAGRYLREAPMLAEADKLETYVRSFENAVKLSLIQTIYSAGTGKVILEKDFDSIYSNETKLPYWQVYNSSYVPDDAKLRSFTLRVASSFMTDYIREFKEFVDIPQDSTAYAADFDNESITVIGNELVFERKTKDVHIVRKLEPEARVKTNFVKMIKVIRAMVENDLLGACVSSAETKDQANTCLKRIASSLEKELEEKAEVKLELLQESFQYDGVNQKSTAIINCTFIENVIDYPVYDYSTCENPRLNNFYISFLARVGNLIVYDPDQVIAKNVQEFKDCNTGVGIIGAVDCGTWNVCESFVKVLLTLAGCMDSDEGILPHMSGRTRDIIDSKILSEGKDTCDFSPYTWENNLTEFYCLGQAGSLKRSTKYNCDEFCRQFNNDPSYTSYCLTKCYGEDEGEGFCFCKKDCELNYVRIEEDCFLGESPYCEPGDKIKVHAEYSGSDCPFPSYIQVDSFNDTDCKICSFNWRKNGNTCGPSCEINGIKVECSSSPCETVWTIPDYTQNKKCWDKGLKVNESFILDKDDNPPKVFDFNASVDGSFFLASCLDSDRIVPEEFDKVYGNEPRIPGKTRNSTHELKDRCLSETILKEFYCKEHSLKSLRYDCTSHCKSITGASGKCLTNQDGEGYCACKHPLAVEALVDVVDKPLEGLRIKVNGESKSTDSSGIAFFKLTPGTFGVEVEMTKDSRYFSHFWDHDCDGFDNWLDISSNPYSFEMRERTRTITAFYRAFTKIEGLSYNGSYIEGKLLDENGNPLLKLGYACRSCGNCKMEDIDRKVSFEYYDGDWHFISIVDALDDGSFSQEWNFVPGASKIRASYSPSNWYYSSSSSETSVSPPTTTTIPPTDCRNAGGACLSASTCRSVCLGSGFTSWECEPGYAQCGEAKCCCFCS